MKTQEFSQRSFKKGQKFPICIPPFTKYSAAATDCTFRIGVGKEDVKGILKGNKGGLNMKKHMTSFGVCIVTKVDNGNLENLQEAIGQKVSALDVNQFPSLLNISTREKGTA